MTDLHFRDHLTTNAFSTGNYYNFAPVIHTSIPLLRDYGRQLPFFAEAPETGFPGYDTFFYTQARQFGNRVITRGRLLEVADSSSVPLTLNYNDKLYLVAKGFIGTVSGSYTHEITPLFMATIPFGFNERSVLKEVTFYISRKVNLPEHKEIKTIVEQFAKPHTGDVVMTDDIFRKLQYTIPFPDNFPTLASRKQFSEQLATSALEHFIHRTRHSTIEFTPKILPSYGI